MVEIVAARPEHFQQLIGHAPERTVRAWAAVDEERVIGLAGFYPEQARLVLWAIFGDEIRKNKRLMVRGYRFLLDMARQYAMPVHAYAEPSIEGSDKLLEHMGFRHLERGVYEWQT